MVARATPIRMATKIKIAALVLVAAVRLWPAFQRGVEGRLSSVELRRLAVAHRPSALGGWLG